MKAIISQEIKEKFPELCVAVVEAQVANTEFDAALWERIERACTELRGRYSTETLKLHCAINATRAAYRKLGKDPSRYRPSGEALVRRVLQGKELYRINTLVDLCNLASIDWGYSIGGFDMSMIKGDTVTLGVGHAGEPYEGIGRGVLNIENLPVWRDEAGGIGTPTSDNERTKMSLDTSRILFIVNGYDGNRETVRLCAEELRTLLKDYANSDGGTLRLIVSNEQ